MLYFIAIIIVIAAFGLVKIFTPNEDALSRYSRRRVPGLDQHLKSDKFLQEAEVLREIVNRHRTMERQKREEKKSDAASLQATIAKLTEQRDLALGAAITPESVDGNWMFTDDYGRDHRLIKADDEITYEDWIHVYGGEKESS